MAGFEVIPEVRNFDRAMQTGGNKVILVEGFSMR